MESYTYTARNGETITLQHDPESGGYPCPVCGHLLAVPAYAVETGKPSMEWCPQCDVQFGWDDRIAPDAPDGAQAACWARLAELSGFDTE